MNARRALQAAFPAPGWQGLPTAVGRDGTHPQEQEWRWLARTTGPSSLQGSSPLSQFQGKITLGWDWVFAPCPFYG